MKKTFITILVIVGIIVALFIIKYIRYQEKVAQIKEYNVQFEQYLDKELYGTEIATVINKAVVINEQKVVKKNENGKYIQNNTDSVNIEVKINDLEEEKIYNMETLYNGGMQQFVQYYNNIKFKSSKVEYNSEKKISYILFEQITT